MWSLGESAFEKLTGYTSDEIIGHTPRWKSGVQDTAFYSGLWQTILDGAFGAESW